MPFIAYDSISLTSQYTMIALHSFLISHYYNEIMQLLHVCPHVQLRGFVEQNDPSYNAFSIFTDLGLNKQLEIQIDGSVGQVIGLFAGHVFRYAVVYIC